MHIGIGITDPTAEIHVIDERRLEAEAEKERNFTQEISLSVEISSSESGWVDAVTITPTDPVAGDLDEVWTRGMVEVKIMGHSEDQSNSIRTSRWYIDNNPTFSNLTVAVIGTDVTSGSNVADFQLAVNGTSTAVIAQLKSGDPGVKKYIGYLHVKVYAPVAMAGPPRGGAAAIEWAITQNI